MHKTENGRTTIIGLTSATDHNLFDDNGNIVVCNGRALYTRVGYFLDWIEQLVGTNHC